MTFTDDIWAAVAELRAQIDRLPFVQGLGDGSLSQERFAYYMAQDALYLADYARAIAHLAAAATEPEQILFWLDSAKGALTAERELHAAHVEDLRAAEMSPTCRAYTSYLLSLVDSEGYAVAAAGVLPCFWIYQDVGDRLLAAAGDLTAHPYRDWISVYADEAFAASVIEAKRIVDDLAEHASPDTRAAMAVAFITASRWEYLFWDAAWRLETWPA